MTLSGSFEVNLKPIDPYAIGKDGVALYRMSIDKTYTGPLTATSQGEMLSAMTTTEGSAGYVAIEQVSGTLNGKAGSFVLQHSGTMHKGAQSLSLHVVPDSGSGELTGLVGEMRIIIDAGKHYYEFDYQLPGEQEWV